LAINLNVVFVLIDVAWLMLNWGKKIQILWRVKKGGNNGGGEGLKKKR